jgi:hypothetical protein
MDHVRFDVFTRSLGTVDSRRGLARVVTGGGLGALFSAFGAPDVDAKKHKKKHKTRKKQGKQKLVRNGFGCVDVGQRCAGNSLNCCSGICQGTRPKKGKKDRSICVAHNTGICTVDTNACALGVELPCSADGSRSNCSLTTGNAAFCAAIDPDEGARPNCRSCAKDIDCQGEFGPGAACVVLGGVCTPLCLATGRTACLPPAI